MLKLFLMPPVIVAIYLVAMNWSGMYQKPDIIAIPVVFEIIAFIFAICIAAPTYWLLVLPASYLMIKLTGTRLGGVVIGLILASVIPCLLVTLDYPDLSWRGTLSMKHVLLVMLPLLFMSLYGYSLLNRHLMQRYGGAFTPWLSPTALRAGVAGLFVILVGLVVITSYCNQPPETSRISWTEEDKTIQGQALLKAQQTVIETLLSKRGGLMRDSLLPPYVMLDNVQHWERGVERQVHDFSRLLDYTSFFFENPIPSTRRRPQAPFLSEIPDELKQANSKIQQATRTTDPKQAVTLYREGLTGIEQLGKRIIATDMKVKGHSKLRGWVQEATSNMSRPGTELLFDKERIDEALHPRQYSPRGSSVIAIQPLWKENDALYESYGSAWALLIYLDAIAVEYRSDLEEAGAMPILQRAQTELEQCLPGQWTPLLLMPTGMTSLQQEINRTSKHMQEAMLALNVLVARLK